jgi:hypothetical protein
MPTPSQGGNKSANGGIGLVQAAVKRHRKLGSAAPINDVNELRVLVCVDDVVPTI